MKDWSWLQRLCIIFTGIGIGTAWGMYAEKQKVFPAELVRSAYFLIAKRNVPPPAKPLGPELITLADPEDVGERRAQIIRILWGSGSLPRAQPLIEHDIRDDRWTDRSIARIDRLTVAMDFGLESRAYHFVPASPNGRLIVFHQGHDGHFELSREIILRFLKRGFSVAAFSMPLLGPNNTPQIFVRGIGNITLTAHPQLAFLTPNQGHPVRYFLEPVIVSLNKLAPAYSDVSMVGISGGGWTTTLVAALDPRIRHSFPVAGSYPLALLPPGHWGDYEQTRPAIYKMAGYLDLYVMGAFGEGRQQVQILNMYDPCCFNGRLSDSYKHIVSDRVSSLGSGSYTALIDETHQEHKISGWAVKQILERLGA